MNDNAAVPAKGAAAGRKRRSSPVDGELADSMSSGKMVGAVVAAIKILRFMAAVREPLGVSHIAKETGLNTSTTFNILRTLMLYDFVQFEQLSKTYILSLGILEIAQAAMAIGGDIGVVRPAMERIAQEHSVTVTLWQPTARDRKILIMTAQPRNPMRIQMAIGQRLPLLIGSTGRIFAAFSDMDEAEIKDQFDQIRWNGPIAFTDYMAQVHEAREKGWAMDTGNFAQGTVLVSTPIYSADGNAALAVTATMFTGQYDPGRTVNIVRDLEAFSEQAARALPN
ncbi:MAG: IclR family transcriptional regulator [Paracoccaceae bacterium]